jgi:hypothetical protein
MMKPLIAKKMWTPDAPSTALVAISCDRIPGKNFSNTTVEWNATTRLAAINLKN